MPRYDFKTSSSTSFTVTADGTSDSLPVPNEPLTYLVQLNVSASDTQAGDILRVWVQHSVDGGSNWHDKGCFANVLGNDSLPVIRKMEWTTGSVTTAEEAKQDAAVAASTVRNGPTGGLLRLKWTVTDASTDDATFTFTALVLAVE